MHTFDTLKDKKLSELEQIKKQSVDEYAEEIQKRWNVIAAILFYQKAADDLRKE